MPTIRFPTSDRRHFNDYKLTGKLRSVPFQIVQSNGHTRLPKPPMFTLADLDKWMKEHGYKLVDEQADHSSYHFGSYHIVAHVVPNDDPRETKPAKPLPAPTPCPATDPQGEPQQSVHLALWEAYSMGDMLSFALRPDNGWTLTVAFSTFAAAQHFARTQRRRRGVKITLATVDTNLFTVRVPVHVPHRPHPNALMLWHVENMDELTFKQTLATAGLTHI